MTAADPSSTIVIRPARRDERAAAAEIAVAAFAALAAHIEPAERAVLFDRVRGSTTDPEPGEVIVAVANGRVVGTVVYNGPAAEQQHSLIPADWAFFRALGVDAAWVGQGIGRRLVEDCIARARRQGASSIGLYAADVNEIAVGLYRRMGFKEIGAAFPRLGIAYRVYGLELYAV